MLFLVCFSIRGKTPEVKEDMVMVVVYLLKVEHVVVLSLLPSKPFWVRMKQKRLLATMMRKPSHSFLSPHPILPLPSQPYLATIAS